MVGSCGISHKQMCLQIKQTWQMTVSHTWCQDLTLFFFTWDSMCPLPTLQHESYSCGQKFSYTDMKHIAVLGFQWFLWIALFQRKHDCTTYIFNRVKVFLKHHLRAEVFHYSVHFVQCTSSSSSKTASEDDATPSCGTAGTVFLWSLWPNN